MVSSPARAPLRLAAHPAVPLITTARRATTPSKLQRFRQRDGNQNSNRQAIAALPVAYQRAVGCAFCVTVEAFETVEMVMVATSASDPAIWTELVEPKLMMGRFCAPEGLAVICAARVTVPVKPNKGVTVMVDVFAVVAP